MDAVLTYQYEPRRAGPFDELDEVRLVAPAKARNGEIVPEGSYGTVLAVWAAGEAYEVEFDAGLATVKAMLLRPAP